MKNDKEFSVAVGVALALNIAWVVTLIWVVYTVVSWLTSK